MRTPPRSGTTAKTAEYVQQVVDFRRHFEDAFDELHAAVVQAVKTPGTDVGPHPDYPSVGSTQGGFPYFKFVRNPDAKLMDVARLQKKMCPPDHAFRAVCGSKLWTTIVEKDLAIKGVIGKSTG